MKYTMPYLILKEIESSIKWWHNIIALNKQILKMPGVGHWPNCADYLSIIILDENLLIGKFV